MKVRPVQLIDGAPTGKASAVDVGSAPVKNLKVTRADVAAFALEAVSTNAWARKAPIIQG